MLAALMDLTGKTVLVTGGTGSFGTRLVERLLTEHAPRTVRVFSRDDSSSQSSSAGSTTTTACGSSSATSATCRGWCAPRAAST